MLVLSRKAGEEIVVSHGDITISVLGITEEGPAGRLGALGNSGASKGNPSSDRSGNEARGDPEED